MKRREKSIYHIWVNHVLTVLLQDIDLKSFLYEAYHKCARELLYVVPFTAKVLESCAKSKVGNSDVTLSDKFTS